MRKLIVLSGGLDSTILLYSLVEKYGANEIIALSFDFKQNKEEMNKEGITFTNNLVELNCSKKTCEELGVMQIILPLDSMKEGLNRHYSQFKQKESFVDNKGRAKTIYPFRNMMLISTACSIAQSFNCDELFLGFQKQDKHGYWDTTPKFVKSLNKVLSLNNYKIKISCPFVNMHKDEEIKLGLKLNVNFKNTWTCYSPKKVNNKIKACGLCPACKDRLLNFKKLNMKDPLDYETN